MRGWLASALVLLLPWAALSQPAESSEPDVSTLQLAIASFEAAGPAARSAPAIGQALGEALRARGVGRVVGPAELGLAPQAGSEEAVEAARRAGVGGVVTGRVTQLGSRLSVDLRLRSTGSGSVLGTYVAEVPIGDPVGPAADSLAERVVLGALNLVDGWGSDGQVVAVPRPSRGTPAGRPAPAATRGGASPPFALGDLSGLPLSILADELEATERDGVRTLVFKQAVKVEQGDLELEARQLSADYLAGEKQPHRLMATGDVSLRQGDREARCDRAVYEPKADRIVCQGNALLRDGQDEIEGGEIAFDMAARGVVVEGGTELRLDPSGSSAISEEAGLGELPQDAPIHIRAERLEAQEGPEPALNRILLEGGVEVVQSGVTLRSDRLEILYPQDAQHPERMEATGSVSLSQGGRQARCERAIYRAAPHRIECMSGDLDDLGDVVAGDLIAFDLDEDRVTVNGRARLHLAGRDEARDAPEAGDTP